MADKPCECASGCGQACNARLCSRDGKMHPQGARGQPGKDLGRGNLEERLIPINALLSLVESDGINPPVLRQHGYQLAGLEVPMASGGSRVVADVVLANGATGHLVPAEAKSGSNIEEDQGKRYAALDARTVVRSTFVSVEERVEPSIEVLYACLDRYVDRVLLGLQKAELHFPVLSVATGMITLRNPDAAGDVLRSIFVEPLRRSPRHARIIRFDPDSDLDSIRPSVDAALVAELAHSKREITIHSLAEKATPHFALYGHAAQQKLCKKIAQIIGRIAREHPETYALQRAQGHPGIVRLLRTPEALDPKGRTQSYQALARNRPARRRAPKVHPGQTELAVEQALLDELEAVDAGEGTQSPVKEDGTDSAPREAAVKEEVAGDRSASA